MITEIARITIKPDTQREFLAAVARSVPLFQGAKGYLGLSLSQVIEEENVYLLKVDWQALEDHTVTFRNSAAFQGWRENVSLFFATPPQVTHLRACLEAGAEGLQTAPQQH